MSGISHPKFDARRRVDGRRRYTQSHGQDAGRALHRLIRIGAKIHDQIPGERGVGAHHGHLLGDLGAYFDAGGASAENSTTLSATTLRRSSGASLVSPSTWLKVRIFCTTFLARRADANTALQVRMRHAARR